MPTITDINCAYSYDQTGEYIYLALSESNIDTSKIYPIIYRDGAAVTEFVNASRNYIQYIYKLKKLSGFYELDCGYFMATFKLCAADKYEFIDAIGYDALYLDQSTDKKYCSCIIITQRNW